MEGALERLQAVRQGEAQGMRADPPLGRKNVGPRTEGRGNPVHTGHPETVAGVDTGGTTST